jgi:NADPH2:quinone reductase
VVGDRVGYASAPIGAYVEERDYPADKLIKMPDFINDDEAASVLLKGMTVEYLFNRTYKIKPGEFFLFHAAAGGVGLFASQWARTVGARMIGTVSTEEKADLAKKAGCEFLINYKKENVVEKVKEITGGSGVAVVYDGVGKDTFEITLNCLCDRGLFVSFGQSSGMIDPVSLHKAFAPKNLYYTRPSLLVYNKTKEDIIKSSEYLFGLLKNKKIQVSNITKYNLKDAAQCHKDLQLRKTTGSLVLVP